MKPTIYKPSIYNGAGIYKTGAEGGGGGVFFYEFNLSRFDLNTLKDGDVQWICSRPNYLSKESDCLKVNVNGSGFNLYFRPDIDKTKKIIAEFEISFPTTGLCYSGFGCGIDGGPDYNFMLYNIGNNITYFKNSALCGSIQNYNVYNGGKYNGSWTYNSRFDEFPYIQKQKIKLELNTNGHGKFYIDDVLSLECEYIYNYDFFLENFKFYINLQTSSGVVKFYSLKIWQE